MTATLMVLHGVLRAPSGAAIADGVDLYRSLSASTDMVLLTDTDDEDTRWWLKRERIELPPYLLHADTGPREAQLAACRTVLGLPVGMFITSSPHEAAVALRLGFTSVCFSHPLFAREEFRPDAARGRRPWAELAGEIEHQERLLEQQG